MTLSFRSSGLFCKKRNLIIVLLSFAAIINVPAQIKPMAAIFYQNQYLANPAMAGLEKGAFFNLSYRKQLNSVSGALTEQTLTGAYGFSKAAVGLNIYNEKAGLLKRTRVVGSYAYHLPLDMDQKLHFGISVGMLSEKVDNSFIKGDATDVNVSRFNDRNANIDGDFGIAYTFRGLTIQGAVSDLNNFINAEKTDLVNYATFFSALSYKFYTGKEIGAVGIEPKLCFRGIKKADGILDAGVNVSFAQERFNILGMYHSAKNATFGFGINYKKLTISGIYSSVPSAFRGYTDGDFELGLGIRL